MEKHTRNRHRPKKPRVEGFPDTVQQGDYDIARAGWIGDYMYPDTFLFMWTTGNGNNETGWSNPEYDKLISDSYLESDAEKRLEMLYDAETILLEEMPIAPIYFYTSQLPVGYEGKRMESEILGQSSIQVRLFRKLTGQAVCSVNSRNLRTSTPSTSLLIRFLLIRLLQSIPVLLAVYTITFVMIKATPGSPFDDERKVPPAVLEKQMEYYGYGDSLLNQYWNLLYRHITLTSPIASVPGLTSGDIIKEHFGTSIELGLLGMAAALLIGIPAGVLASWKKNSAFDYVP